MLKIEGERILDARQYAWSDVRDDVKQINPVLSEIIDNLSLSNKYLFTKVSYPFGMDIIKNGQLYLPVIGGGSIPINHPSLPIGLRTNTPVALVLDKNLEFYSTIGERMASHRMVHPGEILGFASVLNDEIDKLLVFRYSLSAGARNIFIPSKIADKRHHHSLQKEFNISAERPKHYKDQHEVFKELVENSNSEWVAPVLIFPEELIEHLKQKEVAFTELRNHLLYLHRSSYGIWHNEFAIWKLIFSEIEENNRLLSGYELVLPTLKHILTIRANGAPGFIATSDELYAPSKLIQDIYTNVYKIIELTGNYPTLMVPSQLGNQNLPNYYSFSYPTLPECSPDNRSILSTLDVFTRAMEIYKKGVKQSDAKTRAPSLYDAVLNTTFECYHPDPGTYKNIKNSIMLPDEDARFRNQEGAFPARSAFFTGCVKVSPKC